MNARAIELLGGSNLLREQRAAGQAVDEWRAFWGLRPREAQVACARAWESAERGRALEKDWTCWECENGNWAAASPGLASGVRRTLFGPPQMGVPESGAPLALDLCNQAVDDLASRLLKKGGPAVVARRQAGPAIELPAGALRHGSGAALLDIQIDEGRLLIVTRCAPPLRQDRTGSFGESHLAVHAVPVTVGAELDELELDLATLQSLETGDVIRLGARIDHPLRISAPGGGTICFGDFGTQEGFRALSLRKSAVHEGA